MTGVDYRYARGLLTVAKDRNKTGVFRGQMQKLLDTLKNTPELNAVLASPNTDRETKKRIMTRVFSGVLDKELLNFVMLVMDRNRENRLEQITNVFINLADRERSIVTALVVTTRALREDEKELLKAKLSLAFGLTVEIQSRIDKSILGGIVIKLEDKLLDGSLRGRLEAMEGIVHDAVTYRIGEMGKGGS
jgi:F-type H+-transporting ATPase subunit delta